MFGFKLKKKHNAESCCCKTRKSAEMTEIIHEHPKDIAVLGTGQCTNCHLLHQRVCEAAKELGLAIDVEYVTDMKKIVGYGVMSLPALVINGKPAAVGKVLKKEEIIKLLSE